MDKIPKLEINSIPSALNTSKPTGVASQLANVAAQEPHYDGITIDQMRNNPLFERIDDIDKIGKARNQLAQHAKTIKSRTAKIRAVNEMGRRMNIPDKSKK